MWGDVFLHTVATTGEKLAIVVMDTQGLFDNETSPADNSKIFALGTLISSVQVLNLFGVIQEDQLQYLQFATEFAKFAGQNNDTGKTFQNLLFLIRDWNYSGEHMYGKVGGENYLKKILEVKINQKPEIKLLREFLAASFDRLSCCLLPPPGKHVAGSQDYNGCWKLMEEEFKEEFFIIIEELLGPDKLVVKKINGKDLDGAEYEQYLESYFGIFQSETLPEPESIYESTIEKQMSILISKCVEFYKEHVNSNEEQMNEKNLHIIHESSKNRTLIMFKDQKKMGSSKHEKKFEAQLDAQIEKLFVEWKDATEKNLQRLKEEQQKVEEANKEKHRLEQEALEAEKIRQTELAHQKEILLKEQEKKEAELEANFESERKTVKHQQELREQEIVKNEAIRQSTLR